MADIPTTTIGALVPATPLTGNELMPVEQGGFLRHVDVATLTGGVSGEGVTSLAADGVTDDTTALQAAIDAASAQGANLLLPSGTISVGLLNLPAGFTLRGRGIGRTVLLARGGDMVHVTGTGTMRSSIAIEDVTLDAAFQNATSPIVMEWVEDVALRRLEVRNFSGWGASFGAYSNGGDTAVRVRRLLVEDCYFHDPAAGNTLEALLLFNCSGVTVRGCDFVNATPTTQTNAIGIYQVADDVLLEDNVIDGWARGTYYSLSTRDVTIRDSTYARNATGVGGANMSDNGAFGATHARNVMIEGTHFTDNLAALFLGGLVGGLVDACSFEWNVENAIVIDDGQAPVSAKPEHLKITNTLFRNNNQANSVNALHPGILFQSVGGALHTLIEDCTFIDDQASPTQTHPIVFTGAFEWDYVTIRGGHIRSYAFVDPVTLADGATLGEHCRARDVTFLPLGATIPDAFKEGDGGDSIVIDGGTDFEFFMVRREVGGVTYEASLGIDSNGKTVIERAVNGANQGRLLLGTGTLEYEVTLGGTKHDLLAGVANPLATLTIVETATGVWSGDAPARALGVNPIVFIGEDDPSGPNGIATPANINAFDSWDGWTS